MPAIFNDMYCMNLNFSSILHSPVEQMSGFSLDLARDRFKVDCLYVATRLGDFHLAKRACERIHNDHTFCVSGSVAELL